MGATDFVTNTVTPWVGAASGVAGLLGALFGPSPEEQARTQAYGQSMVRGVDAANDYNSRMAAAFSMDPGRLMQNFMRGQVTADAIGGNAEAGHQGIQFHGGGNLLSKSPGLGAIINMLRAPSTYGMQTGKDGNITGWRPQSFTPATLNEDGKMVGGGQQTYGGQAQSQNRAVPKFGGGPLGLLLNKASNEDPSKVHGLMDQATENPALADFLRKYQRG